ncbi:TIGR01777 family oxidoreductase [Pseudodesulfovibrio pelocollis]|uniref:TIGR01777 family oxidoreductase n=1 Tax=Pseudodesulfovibrio pelocollis TaxID=3051432 RepID=UPI00255AAC1F|nr:TIGR01777 family oxidoreductase [Pseudodesulfovibrio sp. SB368]
MRAVIAGGTGFIGQALVAELRGAGWEIVVLSRSPAKVAEVFGHGVIGMRWDGSGWLELLGPDTAVVNLAGENIAAGRWTAEVKRRILESRVNAGRALVKAVAEAPAKPGVFVQASAVGYYGPRGTEPLDEGEGAGNGYLAEVCRAWEASTAEVEAMGVRRVIVRTGMVLGNGGALARMLPPFRYFVGGPPGSGMQGVSWIHLDDEVRAIRFLMENPVARGAYNLTAPAPVRFRRFARILGQTLGRPYRLKAPAFALRLLFGEMADEVLLSGQLALPTRLVEAGYEFRHPDLEGALADLLGKGRAAA